MKVPEPRKLDSGVWFIQLRLGGQSVPVTDIDAKACKHNAELIKSEYLNGRRLQRVASSSLTLSQGIDNFASPSPLPPRSSPARRSTAATSPPARTPSPSPRGRTTATTI